MPSGLLSPYAERSISEHASRHDVLRRKKLRTKVRDGIEFRHGEPVVVERVIADSAEEVHSY